VPHLVLWEGQAEWPEMSHTSTPLQQPLDCLSKNISACLKCSTRSTKKKWGEYFITTCLGQPDRSTWGGQKHSLNPSSSCKY
jgi:hypothetical protein